ncbi:von Willebrand factor type A domain-containing protein [Dunaliella salina]|uniref:von Willebrand factor type A domain-containing protein n=1 Tax=Dunaliella salina TaxID=3046 RepID=A0ABQ7GM24_DUNSA|nr:von Willebrand factor type A domain-containing protein [Dunaliella salina]|eukprot:KAF5835661.1 von Willebrand factor type A domain-containing protein [Dunaliella salina]
MEAYFDIDSAFPPASPASSSTCSSTCLLDREGGSSIPLKSRDVQAHVYADARFSAVEERLNFIPDKDAQVTFKFPLPHRAVVHRFEATMGTRELRTEVKPAAAAEAEYHEAVAQGHSAAKVKQDPESSIYTVDLGNLTAHEPCIVRLHYLCLLECFAGTLEWVHTSTWVPPYILPELDEGSAEKAAKAVPTFAKEVSYTLSYVVHIYSSTGVRSVSSAEAINEAEGLPGSSCQRVVSLASDVADPSWDFRLLVELAQPDNPPLCTLNLQRCQRNTHTKTVGLASFCLPRTTPERSRGVEGRFKSVYTPEQSSSQPEPTAEPRQAGPKKELVLVVDCSGSMSGDPIKFARDAALYFVRDLPIAEGIKFQIVLFGSSHKTMSTTSVDYDAQAEQHAVTWINTNVNPNFGGTEIYKTMRAVYDTPIPEGYERQIIFLTDGGAMGDENFTEKLLQKHEQAAKTTVQCLGIGHGVHRKLVDTMASTTGGLSQFAMSAQDIVPACSFLKKCALSEDVLLQPRLKPKLCMLRSVPAVLPPRLFAGEPLLVLTEIVKAEKGAALEFSAVRITGEKVSATVPIPDASEELPNVAARAEAGTKVAHLEGDAIATLHAMAYIKCLIGGKSALHIGPDGTRTKRDDIQAAVQDQVVKLATEEGIVTQYTSAVGVLLQADPKDPRKTQQMEVPLKLPQGRTLWAADRAPRDPTAPGAPEMMKMGGGGSPLLMANCSAPLFGSSIQSLSYQAPPDPFAFSRIGRSLGAKKRSAAPTAVFGMQTQSLFGSAAPDGAWAGSAPPGSAVPATAGPSLFGPAPPGSAPTGSAPSPTLLGSAMPGSTPPGPPFLFGAAPSGSAQPAPSLFGSAPPTGSTAPPPLFGSAMPASASPGPPSLFGAAPPTGSTAPPPLFGLAMPASASPGPPSLFGAAPPTASTAPPPLFGSAMPASASPGPPSLLGAAPPTASASPPPLFGSAMPASASPGPNLFGAALPTGAAPMPGSAMPEPALFGSAPPAAPPFSRKPTTPAEMLNRLNLSRTIEGFWETDASLLEDLQAQRSAKEGGKDVKELVEQVQAAKPAALSPDLWATVLVLAYLRQHLSQQRPQWQGMEAKALSWLQAHWPEGQGVQSVGSCVLSAMKLV